MQTVDCNLEKMGVHIYNSIRIFKQDKSKFSVDEFEGLKSFVFNSPRLHRNKEKFVSRFTPIIFELVQNDFCIEAQFDRYNDWAVWDNIEHLYEMTFPFYEFWFILCYNSSFRDECTDQILSFRYIEEGTSDYPKSDFDNLRICKYTFDKINIENLSLNNIPSDLKHIDWKETENGLTSMGYSGLYHSNSEKSFTLPNDNYRLTLKDGLIPFKEKYSLDKGGINYNWINKEWYSDPKLENFIKNEFVKSTIKTIEFQYNNRLVRKIETDKYDHILTFDGWDNCADEEYLGYLQKRIKTTTNN